MVPIVPPTMRRPAPAPGGRNILRIAIAGAADAAHGGQALLKGREPAVGAAFPEGRAVIGAPRIVLRLGARTKSRHGGANANRREPEFHGGSPRRMQPRAVNTEVGALVRRYVPSTPHSPVSGKCLARLRAAKATRPPAGGLARILDLLTSNARSGSADHRMDRASTGEPIPDRTMDPTCRCRPPPSPAV